MSIKVTSRVWDVARQDGTALCLLLALADMANDDGICWPKVVHLAQKCRKDERQTKRLLKQLQNDGDLYLSGGGGRGKPSLYLVLTGLSKEQIAGALISYFKLPPQEAQEIAETLIAKQKGDIHTTVSVPPIQETVTSASLKGDIHVKERVTSASQAPAIHPDPIAQTAPLTVMGIRHDPLEEEGGNPAREDFPSEEAANQPVADESKPPELSENGDPPLPIPAVPPPITRHAALAVFAESAGRPTTPAELNQLDRWAEAYADGWYWIVQAIKEADKSGRLSSKYSLMGWLRATLERWSAENSWGSPLFLPIKPAARKEETNGTAETATPNRPPRPAGPRRGASRASPNWFGQPLDLDGDASAS